jgi:DNA-binding NarL/FixJ family response regulator
MTMLPVTSPTLTPREVEILRHFALGFTYAETAAVLRISVNTVREHVRKLYDKLQACSKTEAVMRALAMMPELRLA